MAKLSAPPDISVVRAFKGKLDFYTYGGQWYVRKWPQPQKTTVTARVVPFVTRFTYVSHVYRALMPSIVDCWRAEARQTRWTWRDVLTRNFSGASTRSTGPKPPLKMPHLPFPTPRSPFWLIYVAGYHFTPTAIDLFFWFDQLVPSVALTAQPGLDVGPEIWKARRGVNQFCGRDLVPSPVHSTYPLTCPAFPDDPNTGCGTLDLNLAWHAASIPVFRGPSLWAAPFDGPPQMLTVAFAYQDCTKPGSQSPISSSFFFYFDHDDLAHRYFQYLTELAPTPAIANILPPDPFYATRPLYNREQLHNRKLDVSPPFYFDTPRIWPLGYDELHPYPFCTTESGLLNDEDRARFPSLPDTSFHPVCVHHSSVTWRTTRTRTGSASAFLTPPPHNKSYVAHWDSGARLYYFFGTGFDDACKPSLHAWHISEPPPESGPDPLPPSNCWRAQAQVTYPLRQDTPFHVDTVQEYPGVIALPQDLCDNPPPGLLNDYVTHDVITQYKFGPLNPWECLNPVQWHEATTPRNCRVYIDTLGDNFPGTPTKDVYQNIGSGVYNPSCGPIQYTYFLPYFRDYWGNGGVGVPYNPLGPVESLLDDPFLLSIGFHYP